MASFQIGEGSLSPFLKKYNYRFVVNFRDNVSLVVELLDVLPEGLSFLLDNAI
jgi:hypothetical protein